MNQIPDAVECYSGGEYADQPRALLWQGARLEVAQVLQRWRSPEGKGFLVSTADGRIFELTYQVQADAWVIVEK